MEYSITFIKLGGSLITDKLQPHTPRIDVIERLANEIAASYKKNPSMRLIIGHGSGSFGHIPAKKYHTRDGVLTKQDWLGFAEVWKEARQLNDYILKSLWKVGLPVISFPPSSTVINHDGQIISWESRPLRNALDHQLIPVVYGDVVMDEARGGTITSTEELFSYLNGLLYPTRILIAGKEEGVWEDFPSKQNLIRSITPLNFHEILHHLGKSNAVDVTGGMIQKVSIMLDLIKDNPQLEAVIFSGEIEGQVSRALLGESPGTKIHQPFNI